MRAPDLGYAPRFFGIFVALSFYRFEGEFDLLAASDSFPEYAEKLMLYGQFVGSWEIARMQPYSGKFVHWTGRKVGDHIVQEGVGTDSRRRERWSFTEITQDSFVWLGEASFDNGATWFLEQEMRGLCR